MDSPKAEPPAGEAADEDAAEPSPGAKGAWAGQVGPAGNAACKCRDPPLARAPELRGSSELRRRVLALERVLGLPGRALRLVQGLRHEGRRHAGLAPLSLIHI